MPNTYKERLTLQAEYDLITSQHTTELLLHSRSKFYEQGDRTTKLLAHRLCQVSASQFKELECPITVAELEEAVKSLQSGKSPGPDAFPAEFYKTFWKQMAPHLLEMFTESYNSGLLPHTLNQTCISLLLKKGKDPLSCGSYRPISLLNVDFKLLSKLLARHLEVVLPSIISLDQTGFIRNRHSFFNLRKVFNVVYNSDSPRSFDSARLPRRRLTG